MKNPVAGGRYIRHKDGTLERWPEGSAIGAERKGFTAAVNETLANERFSATAVFDRVKETLGCDSDAELAWIFGTSPQNISNRRKRNSVPYREAIFVALWARVSLDYLLTGGGELREDQSK
jgi:hypothetical protein